MSEIKLTTMKWFKNIRKEVSVSTFEEWLELPIKSRSFFFNMFFRCPFVLEAGGWKNFNMYTKQNYKIHYFLKKMFSELKYLTRQWIYNPWYYLKCRFWHKYHIINLGPHYHWVDSNFRIEQSLKQILFDYIEKEDAFNRIVWDSELEHQKIYNDLKKSYDFFKVILPKMEKDLEDLESKIYGRHTNESILDILSRKRSPEEAKEVEKIHNLEKTIIDLITEHLVLIIKNRNSMWT